MAAYQDIYLFDPMRFMERIDCLVHPAQDVPSVVLRFREAAIKAFENSAFVRQLACDYGGWDRQGIMEALADDSSQSDQIVFAAALLLYEALSALATDSRFGLGGYYSTLVEIPGGRWTAEQKLLLRHGRRFVELPNERTESPKLDAWQSDLRRIVLEELRPISTPSGAGWLSFADVLSLAAGHAAEQGSSASSSIAQEQQNALIALEERALNALTAAERHRCGLCIIISG